MSTTTSASDINLDGVKDVDFLNVFQDIKDVMHHLSAPIPRNRKGVRGTQISKLDECMKCLDEDMARLVNSPYFERKQPTRIHSAATVAAFRKLWDVLQKYESADAETKPDESALDDAVLTAVYALSPDHVVTRESLEAALKKKAEKTK